MNFKEESRKIYIGRINAVVDYIENNIDKAFTLNELAEKAHFSPFHFHRIFTIIMGESLNDFIKRIKLGKAGSMLVSCQEMPIMEIAFSCGFQSNAVFSRAFKKYFGATPSVFRNDYLKYSKNGQLLSKHNQLQELGREYFCGVNPKIQLIMKKEITIKEMPDF